jgi:heptosyltransferase-2
MKILVRVPNWIGDAVMVLPALKEISRLHSGAEIWVAGRGWVTDLFIGLDYVHDVLSIPETSGFSSLRKFGRKLRGLEFDAGVLFTNSFGSALPFALAGIPERWGYATDGRAPLLSRRVARRRPPAGAHQVYSYLAIAAAMGASCDSPQLELPLKETDREAARRLLEEAGFDAGRPLIILNPGAFYGPAKRWPAERYAELAGRLREETGAEIGIVGSAEEAELARRISRLQGGIPRDLTGRTSLRCLAGIFSLARLCVTNDSGPMHLAVATGTPTVALFGPTDPAATGPFHQPSAVLKKDVVCWPCAYRECPFDHRCMLGISCDEALTACRRFLT